MSLDAYDDIMARNFLDTLYTECVNNVDGYLFRIYDRLEADLSSGLFDRCDYILSKANLNHITPEAMIAMLTITSHAKTHLPARSNFFVRVKERLATRMTNNELAKTLQNLE